jgi:hypothetical protein
LVVINYLNRQPLQAAIGEGERTMEAPAALPTADQAVFVMAAPADAATIASRSAFQDGEPLVDAVFRVDQADAGQELYGNCDDAGWDDTLLDLATAQRKDSEEDEANDPLAWLDGAMDIENTP